MFDDTNEFTQVEDRYYLNPQLAIDESNAFIQNLRDTQAAQNAQIARQTRMLGTDVPTNLGGLTGAESYWTSRIQTPQTNALVQNLRTAAQASALNQALANEQEMWKKRYNDAYRAYQKRQNNKLNQTDYNEGEEPEYKSTSSTAEITPLTGKTGYYSIVDPASGQIIDVPMDGNGQAIIRDKDRYQSPLNAGYALMGTPWRGAGTPGQHMYSTPTGETLYVNLDEGYKIMYDTETGKLVQIKE